MSSSEPIPVLCARPFTPEQLTRLAAVSPRLVITQRPVAKREELATVLTPEVEVLLSTVAPLSLDGLTKLRWFQ